MNGKLSRADLWIVGFTAAYLLAATIAALGSSNHEFLLYIGVVIVAGLLLLAVHARLGLGRPLLWAFSIWGLMHMAGGLVPVPADWPIAGRQHVLYSLWLADGWLKYDHVVHAFGFGVATWFSWQVLDRLLAAGHREAAGSTRPTLGLLVFCVVAGMGFGAFNELVEFIATLLVPETNVGGYENTGWDLASNFAGGVVAAFLIWLSGRHRASPRPARGLQ
jgi:hypothetical protein